MRVLLRRYKKGEPMFTLNPSSDIPICRQLIEQAGRIVSSGQPAPGEPLPSVCELALTHAVNPMTISKACSLLERQRGKAMPLALQHQKKALKNEQLQATVVVALWVVILACRFSAGVGLAFGIMPVSKAAKLDPLAALRCG
jgi:DNA-binding transcriptional regulator YhcF (GntR family)